jgi:hypothetical protein
MSRAIKLVRNDNRPYVSVTLRDGNKDPLDLTDATDVRVYFRATGSETVLSTITCSMESPKTSGVIRFNFPGNTLDVEPGPYEGEIEIDFGGETQTVFDVLKFNVRDQFA